MSGGHWVDTRISWGFDLFQGRVAKWVRKTFGDDVAGNQKERALRFIEEATELAQAIGLTKEQVNRVVDYVFSREPGEAQQEIGGCMVTLSALTSSCSFMLGTLASLEVDRIENPETIERCLVRQEEKRAAGVVSDVEWRACDQCDGNTITCLKCAGTGQAAYIDGRLA